MNRSAAIVALTSIAGVTSPQSQYVWDGAYAGLNLGEARNDTCSSSTLNGAIVDSAMATAFSNQVCPDNSTFIGGAQLGYNIQYGHFVWGLEADFDAWGTNNKNRSLKYAGGVAPPGTYVFSGKLSPNGFGVIGPRIGYAGAHWMPYLTAGGVITGGSHNSTLSYTPVGATKPTASFSGGKNFTSTGWAAGGGGELVLNGPWSIKAEYLHASLGKGSNSTTTCTGSAAACEEFSGLSLDSTHATFTANMFRLGFNYWFEF
jgi:outer membrane immunogenic protein